MTKASSRAPRLARWLVRRLVPADQRVEFEGDLDELWAIRQPIGRTRASFAFWRDVFSVLVRRTTARPSPPSSMPRRSPATFASTVWQDVRYTWRSLRRQPLFAALLLGTVTIGTSSAIAIFTLCDRLLLKPLPYPHPEQVVSIDSPGLGFANGHPMVPKFLAKMAEFTSVGLYNSGGLNLGDDSTPARVRAGGVSAGFFEALGVPPARGRTFGLQEEIDAAPVVVMSDSLWRGRFAGDSAIVGRRLRINGRPFEVIGVMPPGFIFPDQSEVWIPAFAESQMYGAAVAPAAVARLAPGVSLAQSRLAMARANRAAAPPGVDWAGPSIRSLQDSLVLGFRPTLLFLAGVVGLLLVATCTNVAGLLLSRLRVRERELVVRAALGAGRGRLARQLLIECATISLAGGAAGIAIGAGLVRVIASALPELSENADLSLDSRFLLVSLATIAVTGAFFALAPVVASGRGRSSGALRMGTTHTGRLGWTRRGLVMAQVAVALGLLTATSAAVSAVTKLITVDLGFDNDHAGLVEITLPRAKYTTPAQIAAVAATIERSVRAIPGVTTTGLSSLPPASLSLAMGGPVVRENVALDPTSTERHHYATIVSVSPGYFATLGIHFVAGRPFTEAENTTASKSVVISESAARKVWGSPEAAVGQRMQTRVARNAQLFDVVGVVRDVRLRGLSARSESQMYLPFAALPPYGGLTIALGTTGDPAPLLGLLQRRLDTIDPDLPVYNRLLVKDVRTKFMATERLTLALTSGFSFVGLVLCAIGLYGALAQIVTQRTREIGIRLALGASPARLRAGIVWSGLVLTMIGLALGGVAARAAQQLIRHFVPTLDPPPLSAVLLDATILVAIAIAAAWIPSRRASAVDPLKALRTE